MTDTKGYGGTSEDGSMVALLERSEPQPPDLMDCGNCQLYRSGCDILDKIFLTSFGQDGHPLFYAIMFACAQFVPVE